MAIHARFDKHGRRLPDSGRGCGCRQCAEAHAAPYERRRVERSAGTWGPWRRRLVMAARGVLRTDPQQAV